MATSLGQDGSGFSMAVWAQASPLKRLSYYFPYSYYLIIIINQLFLNYYFFNVTVQMFMYDSLV